MYGMIHRGLHDYVVRHHDEAAWEAIVRRSGTDAEAFVAMQSYPDSVVYGLVGAATEVLGRPASEVLRGFGRHWIGYAVAHGFGELLGGRGASVASCLSGLDAMHARISLSFPEVNPPSFRTQHVGPRELLVHYHSERPGLLHFVLGLIDGLADHFRQPVRVELRQSREQGHEHDVVHVEWDAA